MLDTNHRNTPLLFSRPHTSINSRYTTICKFHDGVAIRVIYKNVVYWIWLKKVLTMCLNDFHIYYFMWILSFHVQRSKKLELHWLLYVYSKIRVHSSQMNIMNNAIPIIHYIVIGTDQISTFIRPKVPILLKSCLRSRHTQLEPPLYTPLALSYYNLTFSCVNRRKRKCKSYQRRKNCT